LVADAEGAAGRAERLHARHGVWLAPQWLAPTWEGMVAVNGLLEPEASQLLVSALEPLARPASAEDARCPPGQRRGRPLARPASAEDARSGGQRRADALCELARRALEGGRLPQAGGVRPQLAVVVDLDGLQGHGPGVVGGEAGAVGPLAPEACRRLACDGAVTRVLVTRQPSPHGHHRPDDHPGGPDGSCGPHGHDPSGHHPGGPDGSCGPHGHGGQGDGGLAARLQTAIALLPVLGGAPSQPSDLGRTTRVVTPTQRLALAVRDGGCVVPHCQRPWPGARPTICGTGWTAAPPTWPTSPWCAGPIIGRSTRAAGG
jgi:hypothetical protein